MPVSQILIVESQVKMASAKRQLKIQDLEQSEGIKYRTR
jgi:hypothetical protein